jgi:hypothetical protein
MKQTKPMIFVHADVGGKPVVVKHNGKEAEDNRCHEPAVIKVLDDLRGICGRWSIPLAVAVEIAPGEMLTCANAPVGMNERMHYLQQVMVNGAPWETDASFDPGWG